MYFIVFILDTEEHVVVPYSWLQLNDYMEAMVNNGVNASITFVTYYTANEGAFNNGIPRWNYPPNKNARFGCTFPNEGLYHCHIAKYKGKDE